MLKDFVSRKRLGIILVLALVFILSACGSNQTSSSTTETLTDPSGNEVTVPEEIDSIAVLAPSLNETLVDLGYGDKIVAYDAQSRDLDGLKDDALVLDMMSPDMEALVDLHPDVLLVTNMTYSDQENPYQALIDSGTSVVCVPTSESIEDVQNDISFLADYFDEEEKGQEIIDNMNAKINEIKSIGEGISDRKKVYFEISPAPDMWSFGSNVYLNEMLEIIGAENILSSEDGWLGVTEESVVNANPDIILTNVNTVENPVDEIETRPGWNELKAVKDGQVFYIDNMSSSLPNENITKALDEMAKAIYPEYYSEKTK